MWSYFKCKTDDNFDVFIFLRSRAFLRYIFKNENRETPLWIHKHISRIQRHSASARDAVSRSEALHISARCTRNRLIVLQHIKLRILLSSSSAFDFCKYDSNRAISDVNIRAWSWELFEAFSKVEILMFFGKRALKKGWG